MFSLPGLAAVFSGALLAQPGGVSFGIADVHARPPNSILAMRSGFSRGRYELRNATMVDLIRTAWGVDADNVAGGPDWLEMDRFDVIATAPAGTSRVTLNTMLRGLLDDRFKLVAHKDTKPLPAYALSTGPKLQMTKTEGTEESGCRLQPGSPLVTQPQVTFVCRNVTMAAFASAMPGMRGASGYLFNYGVVDQTGLPGAWDFNISWTLHVPGRTGEADRTTIFDALGKQLGLGMELVKVPTPMVVVDSVNRVPTPNLPEVAAKLPAPPTEFEVSDVKPADPDDRTRGSHVAIRPGGGINVNMTLKDLIGEAWNEWPPERIVGVPKSLDTARFVVVAKSRAPELTDGPAVWNGVDIDSMRIMLRSLLTDRFRLRTHEEERLVAGYALVAARPKLRTAAAGNRPGCKEGLGTDGTGQSSRKDPGKDPRLVNPIASRLVTCRNMTMSQFAATLRETAGLYLHQFPPVLDSTGLDGRYDFTLNFSQPAALPNALRPTGEGEAPGSDPNGAISLFEALDKQLGLKLVSRKLVSHVLVIDHVEEIPTEN